MPQPFTNNNGSTFYNINDCRSFNISLTTALVALTAQPCSEAILINKTGQDVYVYDNNYATTPTRLLLSNNDQFTLRGLTSTSQVSAQTASGTGTLYYRTQYYSFLPQR